MLVAELSRMETCSLVALLMLVALGWALQRIVKNVKSAASTTWTAVSNNPMASAGARAGFWYCVHRLFRWDPLESTCRHASLSIL